MTKIALTAAAILVATGTAFAGSDHYGSSNVNQHFASIDTMITTSISKPDVRVQKVMPLGSDRDLFGNH